MSEVAQSSRCILPNETTRAKVSDPVALVPIRSKQGLRVYPSRSNTHRTTNRGLPRTKPTTNWRWHLPYSAPVVQKFRRQPIVNHTVHGWYFQWFRHEVGKAMIEDPEAKEFRSLLLGLSPKPWVVLVCLVGDYGHHPYRDPGGHYPTLTRISVLSAPGPTPYEPPQ